MIFSGYFPGGLTYERIFDELPAVPLRDPVWPKFLRENAQRVFKLPEKVPSQLVSRETTAERPEGASCGVDK